MTNAADDVSVTTGRTRRRQYPEFEQIIHVVFRRDILCTNNLSGSLDSNVRSASPRADAPPSDDRLAVPCQHSYRKPVGDVGRRRALASLQICRRYVERDRRGHCYDSRPRSTCLAADRQPPSTNREKASAFFASSSIFASSAPSLRSRQILMSDPMVPPVLTNGSMTTAPL